MHQQTAVAPYQVVIIPITRDETTDVLNAYAHVLAQNLREKGVRVMVDDSDMRSPDKMWKWIKRGVPLRVEVGIREVESDTITVTRRDIGKDSKKSMTADELIENIRPMLQQIQSDMLVAAQKRNASMIHSVGNLDQLESALESGKIGFFRIKYDLTTNERFDEMIEKYKISPRCLDDNDPTMVFVAKSY